MTSRQAARALAFAIVTTFSWSLWAACADGPVSTSSAMACCKDGELSCAPHGSAADCCKTDVARPHDAVAGGRVDPVHALQAVIAWTVHPEVGAVFSAQTCTGPTIAGPHLEPGPPPYIEFSSLLI